MANLERILFVCHGNICRSPMAEFIMKALVRAKGLEGQYYIESAAVSSEETGNPIYPPAKRCLRQHGVLFDEGKTARKADPWYTGDFETTFQDILEGCEAVISTL